MKIGISIILLISSLALLLFRDAFGDSFRLIRTSDKEPAKWLTMSEVEGLIEKEVKFMDITDHPNKPKEHRQSILPIVKELPAVLEFQEEVSAAISLIDITRMSSFLQDFSSSFVNRYYSSPSGVESAQWLLSRLIQIQSELGGNYSGTINIQPYSHSNWAQPSIVARIEGADPDPAINSEYIILGAHLDSVNSRSPSVGVAPGADDDGSGVTVLLETFTTLLQSDFVPRRTVEFQFYAAEEVGLRGSQDMAADFYEREVKVRSMLNLDMAGYQNIGDPNFNTVAFITDYTNAELTEFMRTIVEEYLVWGWEDQICGYACSDHASWTAFGYPAVYPSERELDPYMHSDQDTTLYVNYEQLGEIVKLAIGSTVELAQPYYPLF